MDEKNLSVRELHSEDIDQIISYWLNSDPEFMKGMGVDISKIPDREQWNMMLSEQLNQAYHDKKSYCMIWLVDEIPVGHSNVNKIIFGKEAFMHLHLWKPDARTKGYGLKFVKLTLPWFFKNLNLQTLYCEPYALNPAPNKTLEKIGFKFLRSYTCIPGWLNFEQEVNLWEKRFDNL
jgi:RimJ/RimL family protein N-acetyltransferase